MGIYDKSTFTEEQAKEYGKSLRARRKEAKVIARELAELVGVTDNYIYQIECGKAKPSPQLISRIDDAFGAKPSAPDTIDESVLEERKAYGKELFAGRMNKGYSKKLVAGALGISADVYAEFERGECSITDRQKETLDKLLGLSKEVVEEPPVVEETPVEVCEKPPKNVIDIILDHVKDLQVDVDTQKRVWRYFMDMKIGEEERRLFG